MLAIIAFFDITGWLHLAIIAVFIQEYMSTVVFQAFTYYLQVYILSPF